LTHEQAAEIIRVLLEARTKYGSPPSIEIDSGILRALLDGYEAAVKDVSRTEWTCKHRKMCTYFSAVTHQRDCPGCDDWEWRGPAPGKEQA